VAIENIGVNGEENGMEIEVEDLTEDEDAAIIQLKRSRKALDDEEVEVYGSEKKTHFTLRTYTLEVNAISPDLSI